MSARKTEPSEAIKSGLPDGTPERTPYRSRLQLTGEAGSWDADVREQIGGVLFALEQNFRLLNDLSPAAREDAIREIGFLVGPVTQAKIKAVEQRHQGNDPEAE